MASDVTEAEHVEDDATFESLGLVDVLCEACKSLKWTKPFEIQREAIPLALQGRDVIGLAKTGSGKTGAFALPILQAILDKPQRLFALILTPTRELAVQIAEQFEALGASIGIQVTVAVGGLDKMTQAVNLAKKPHIIVATPGRLVDHLETTKGFNLRQLKFLVIDEADRILDLDFELDLNKILNVIPDDRRTFLFSATMTSKVEKLKRASLKDPALVKVSTKYQTVDKLQQFYMFIPAMFKDVCLVYLLNELSGNSFIIFCNTCNYAQGLQVMLDILGFKVAALHGQLSQAKRLGALNAFKSKNQKILVATDVASRGLDIPHVDVVINLDVPTHSKDYIHRVGRTARAGRGGKSITLVAQFDVELYQRIEQLIDKKLPCYAKYDDIKEELMMLQERVTEAKAMAKSKIRTAEEKKRGKKRKGKVDDDDGDDDDKTESMGFRKRIKKGRKK